MNELNRRPYNKPIPHSRPTVGRDEIRLVSEVISWGQLAQGQAVADFERNFSQKLGSGGAVACSSGTAALHLTLLAMEIGPADEVIIPSYVCTALLNAVRYVGAEPVLAETDPETFNMDPADVKERLTPGTKAIIVPHLFGLPADLKSLTSLGVPVIEDCAQALGATYRGKKVGGFGHAAIFSFYATKVIATGEGGMVVSDSKELLGRVRDLREYDKKPDSAVRYNYKLTDIQAALGIAQLDKLDTFIRKRRNLAGLYRSAFSDLPVGLPAKEKGHIYYRFVIRLNEDANAVIERLSLEGIECARPVYRPLHLYLNEGGYRQTERIWRQSLSVPLYPALKRNEADRVAAAVCAALEA